MTADKRLAKAIEAKKIQVGNMPLILRELVLTKKLTIADCEKLLLGLAIRNDYVLSIATPSWKDLRDYSFP